MAALREAVIGFRQAYTDLMAAALLAVLALLLVSSVRQESPTFNESTHLFAGFEYWVPIPGISPKDRPVTAESCKYGQNPDTVDRGRASCL
jgi:hypothetical protein